MKISVRGREIGLAIMRQGDRVVVLLSGNASLVRETQIIRSAASEIMETVLAPLASAGAVVDIYLRTPGGWYQVRIDWSGLTAKTALPVQLADSSARVNWLKQGLSQRRAFVEMKNWLAETVPSTA